MTWQPPAGDREADGTRRSLLQSPWVQGLAIVLLTVAAYARTFRAGFLWDDHLWLWDSRLTVAGDGLLRAWFSGFRTDFYPLTSNAFWILWRLFGHDATGYHVVNVLLHGAGAVLLWRVLLRLRVPAAWVAAAVFAVHPVTVASIAWITELKNTLSLVFYLAALLAWTRFLDAAGPERRREWVLTVVAFVAALLSKSSTVILPVVLLLVAVWRRGRLDARDARHAAPLFALSAAAGVAAIWFQAHRALGGFELAPRTVAERVATSARAVWFYLGKAVAPLDLAVIYPPWSGGSESPEAWLSLAGLAGVAALCVVARRGPGRPVGIALAVFVVTLLPVLGFVDLAFFRYSPVADHWQYLALPAVIALLVGGAATLLRRWGAGSRALSAILAGVAIGGLGVLTFRQTSIYADEGTFWSAVRERNPETWVAWQGLGTWVGSQGRHAEALEYFRKAAELDDGQAEVYRNLGRALERNGEPEEALAAYRRALELQPGYAAADAQLGRLLAERGRFDEGMEHLRRALRAQPDNTEVRFNLAVALSQNGDPRSAAQELREVVRVAPDRLDARYLLAKLLVQLGELEGAAEQLRQVVRRDPEYGEAASALEAVSRALSDGG